MDFEVGDVVAGRYEIKKVLGVGGMGKVYRARQTDLGRDVALKVPSQAVMDNPDVMARFSREAMTVAKLTHDNVVQVYEYFHEEELAFIAMEFVEGADLKDFTSRSPKDVKVKDMATIIQKSCEGLNHAHEYGVVHRDIKPHNIMVAQLPRSKWRVKVMDFGIAHIDQSSAFTEMGGGQLTQTGQALGTPSYMAPEQIRGAGVSHLSDIYAMGCVIYYVFTQQTVFTGSGLTVAVAHLNEQPTPISAHIPGAPEDFERIIMQCLDKEPANRPQDASELGQEVIDSLRAIYDMPMEEIWKFTRQADGATIPILQATTPSTGTGGVKDIQTQQTLAQNTGSVAGSPPAANPDAQATMPAGRLNETVQNKPGVAKAGPDATVPAAGGIVAGDPETAAPAIVQQDGGAGNKNLILIGGVAVACLVIGVIAAIALSGGGNDDPDPTDITGVVTSVTDSGSGDSGAKNVTTPDVGTEATPQAVPTVVPTADPQTAFNISDRPTSEPTATPEPGRADFDRLIDAAKGERDIVVLADLYERFLILARRHAGTDVGTESLARALEISIQVATNTSMVSISGGNFSLGSQRGDEGAQDDEFKAPNVRLRGFSIQKNEVTAIEYAAFLNSGERSLDNVYYVSREASNNIAFDPDLNIFVPKDDKTLHPANFINWTAADEYTKWLSGETGDLYLLPTEPQWEFVAVAGERDYPFGDWAPGTWKSFGNGTVRITQVSEDTTLDGVLHMTGNVREWCRHYYVADWYSNLDENVTNPQGPASSPDFIPSYSVRGGSFQSLDPQKDARAKARGSEQGRKAFADLGFRLVLE